MSSPFIIYADDTLAPTATGDCDCACALATGFSQPIPSLAALELHPALCERELDSDFVVAFVPSVSRVAVLNPAARALLRQPSQASAPDESARDALAQLFQLGLLRTRGASDPPPLPADELNTWLHVTNTCNLRCTYCYLEKSAEAMSAATGYAAVDAVLRAAQRHGFARVGLKYAGGEASLNLALVADLHRYACTQAATRGITLRGVVLSNGIGLTRIKLATIAELGLRLMISLDGPAATHDAQRPRLGGQGSYAAVVASIERARALGLELTVSVTVTGASALELPTLVAWLIDREVHFTLNFYRACESDASQAQLQLDEQRIIGALLAAYRAIERRLPNYSLLGCLSDRAHLGAAHRTPCGAGDSYLVIDQRGGVAKCQMEIAQPRTTIWADDPLATIRLEPHGVQNVAVEEKAGCRDCAWRSWCAGGCPLATYRATGRYDLRSPNCAIYRALYPEVLRLEGLRLLRAGRRVGDGETGRRGG